MPELPELEALRIRIGPRVEGKLITAATVNPNRRGTKCAFWYQLEVPSGGTAELRLRLRPRGAAPERSCARSSERCAKTWSC